MQELMDAPKIQTLASYWLHPHEITWSPRLSEHKSDEWSQWQYWPCYDHLSNQTTIEVENVERQNANCDDQQTLLNDSLVEIPEDTEEEKWNAFKFIVYKVFKEKLSTAIRNHEDWFDRHRMELEEFIINRNMFS